VRLPLEGRRQLLGEASGGSGS